MFERYTEKARRTIFFARYEASQFGSPYIETEHILLGLLREDNALANRFFRSHAVSIREQIEGHTAPGEKVSDKRQNQQACRRKVRSWFWVRPSVPRSEASPWPFERSVLATTAAVHMLTFVLLTSPAIGGRLNRLTSQ